MNYQSYITRLGEMMVEPVSDPTSATPFQSTDANNILPAIIDYAEQRLYRELDLVETFEALTASSTSGSRNVTLPAGIVVLTAANVITPAGSNPGDSGSTRNPLRRVAVDFLNFVFPTGTESSDISGRLPVYIANLDNSTLLLGPTPDAAYKVECIGTFRPTPLSASNTTTILTTYIPDLFLVASMVHASGYQRNYAAAGVDDQAQPINWESQYQALIKSTVVEEARKKAQSVMWSAYSPAPAATPNR